MLGLLAGLMGGCSHVRSASVGIVATEVTVGVPAPPAGCGVFLLARSDLPLPPAWQGRKTGIIPGVLVESPQAATCGILLAGRGVTYPFIRVGSPPLASEYRCSIDASLHVRFVIGGPVVNDHLHAWVLDAGAGAPFCPTGG